MLNLFNDKDEEIRVRFERTDNVVVIKRKLSKKIYRNEINIELFHGDEKLDNNLYVPDGKTSFRYSIINEQSSDIILKVAPNNFLTPALLQVDKQENLFDLKEKISEWFKLEQEIAIYTERGNEVNYHLTVEENNLFDDSEIKICASIDRLLSLSVTNLLPQHASFDINCHISDVIEELKIKICKVLAIDTNVELALFSETQYLEKDKKLFDCSIRNGDLIFYVDLLKNGEEKIEVEESPFRTGKFADVLFGKVQSTGKTIVLKKYSFRDRNISNFKPLINEIITLLKFKSDNPPRFVKLEAMFEKGSDFYIGMEFMEGGSLDDLIPLMENKIIKYSSQILEALIYLHNNKIIYRNMKCSSVLLDDRQDNVKLCNFHLSKYLMDSTTIMLVEGIYGSKPVDYNWAAPEMIAGEVYTVKADIWSFGATLIEMIIGERPYNDLRPAEVKSKIMTTKTIEYENPGNLSTSMENVIELCINADQGKRPTADELKKRFQEMNRNIP